MVYSSVVRVPSHLAEHLTHRFQMIAFSTKNEKYQKITKKKEYFSLERKPYSFTRPSKETDERVSDTLLFLRTEKRLVKKKGGLKTC